MTKVKRMLAVLAIFILAGIVYAEVYIEKIAVQQCFVDLKNKGELTQGTIVGDRIEGNRFQALNPYTNALIGELRFNIWESKIRLVDMNLDIKLMAAEEIGTCDFLAAAGKFLHADYPEINKWNCNSIEEDESTITIECTADNPKIKFRLIVLKERHKVIGLKQLSLESES